MTDYKHPLQGCEFDDMPLGGCYVPQKLSRNMKSRLIPYGIDGEKSDELWAQLITARPAAYQGVNGNYECLNQSKSTLISESQRDLAIEALDSLVDYSVACKTDWFSARVDVAAIRLFIEGDGK